MALLFRPEGKDDRVKDGHTSVDGGAQKHEVAEHTAEAHGGDRVHEAHAGHGHHDLTTPEGLKAHFLGKRHLLDHVLDQPYFEYPTGDGAKHGKVPLPNPFGKTWENPVIGSPNKFIAPTTFQPTKFVVLEVLAALLVAAIVIPCLLYTSPSPRDGLLSRMPSSA